MTSAFAYPQSIEAYLWLSFLTYTVRLLDVFIPVHLGRFSAITAMLRIRKCMNWSAERVLWICEITSISAGVLAVVAACLTVAALVGQVWAGRIVNQRQAAELLKLKADVAGQQARAAKCRGTSARTEKPDLLAQSS